ncbi:MAG: LysM peptidoglycan-binding domain-containing protein, partial [Deltaproteobacteria bacterium]|nr:LysM peptidoglycan-binding domain-containing protein [Deltaproteobacteria bacterium]
MTSKKTPMWAGTTLCLACLWMIQGCTQRACTGLPGHYGSICGPQRSPHPRTPAPTPGTSGAQVVEKCPIPSSAPRTITHEVAPLETVWRIARMYDVKPEAIYRANRLRPQDPI